ncbi:hypothetical protein CUZ56_01079 [Saezia sanguinis]|uniref:EamA domain-containing protein n=1 Tax=Saezia sanguinis TaxID=1965230 RepID=A0A433SEF1_9BURK|nr:EamA family transporter RarD [Saezia sanguinis]RUS67139.1 hypothetical protein CUZ56_01079 [Saezia sanguinis]
MALLENQAGLDTTILYEDGRVGGENKASGMSKGIFFSILASALFGGLYYYASLLQPLSGQEVMGWRILFTLPMVTLFAVAGKEWTLVKQVWQRVKKTPAFAGVLVLNSFLLGIQFWLFMWAPMNDRALQVSLGYFLMPLVMVLVGYFVYGEPLSWLKKLATLLAAVGVANEFFYVGGMAWETLVVALGFPLYFYMRRRFDVNHMGGLWYEIALMLPLSVWFVMHGALSWEVLAQKPALYILIPFLGVLSTTAWAFYVVANKLLPFSLFGLLGYLEPILLVAVSLLLGESIHLREWPTYILIWAAIVVLVLEGGKHMVMQKHTRAAR